MITPPATRPSRTAEGSSSGGNKRSLSDLIPPKLRTTSNSMKSTFLGIVNTIHWLGLGADALSHAERLFGKIPDGLRAVTGRESAQSFMGLLYDALIAEDAFTAQLASRANAPIKQVRELLRDKDIREEFIDGMVSAVMANDDSEEEESLNATSARTNQFLENNFVRRVKQLVTKNQVQTASQGFKSAIEGLDPMARAWFLEILTWSELDPYRNAILSSEASWSSALLTDAIYPGQNRPLNPDATRDELTRPIIKNLLALAGIEEMKETKVQKLATEFGEILEEAIKTLTGDPNSPKHKAIVEGFRMETRGNEAAIDFLSGGKRGIAKPAT